MKKKKTSKQYLRFFSIFFISAVTSKWARARGLGWAPWPPRLLGTMGALAPRLLGTMGALAPP